MNIETITTYREGFKSGLRQLRQMDVDAATQELYEILGVHNRNTFRYYRDGKREPKASQAVAIELVFRKYGVTDNIWGA